MGDRRNRRCSSIAALDRKLQSDSSELVGWVNGLLLHLKLHLPILQMNTTEFEPKHLFMRSVYLLVLGFLLGYLAEQQKQLRAEKAVIARTLGKARVEAGLTGTIQEIASELLSMYGAKQLVIASQETSNYRVFVGDLRRIEGRILPFDGSIRHASDRDIYLYESLGRDLLCAAKQQARRRRFFHLGTGPGRRQRPGLLLRNF